MTVYNFNTQYNTESSDNLPSYRQTTAIAQMLSVVEEGGCCFVFSAYWYF